MLRLTVHPGKISVVSQILGVPELSLSLEGAHVLDAILMSDLTDNLSISSICMHRRVVSKIQALTINDKGSLGLGQCCTCCNDRSAFRGEGPQQTRT